MIHHIISTLCYKLIMNLILTIKVYFGVYIICYSIQSSGNGNIFLSRKKIHSTCCMVFPKENICFISLVILLSYLYIPAYFFLFFVYWNMTVILGMPLHFVGIWPERIKKQSNTSLHPLQLYLSATNLMYLWLVKLHDQNCGKDMLFTPGKKGSTEQNSCELTDWISKPWACAGLR